MAAATLTANAQWYVGGGLGLDFEKANKDADSQTRFVLSPEVGYNLNEKWAVGINLEFGVINKLTKVDTATGEVSANETGTSFFVGPYARYTVAKSGIVSFFVDGGLGFSFQNYGKDDENVLVKYDKTGNVFNIGLRPGIAVKASDKVSFVATTGYFGYRKYSDDVLGGGSKFGLNVNGTALKFGFYYNF